MAATLCELQGANAEIFADDAARDAAPDEDSDHRPGLRKSRPGPNSCGSSRHGSHRDRQCGSRGLAARSRC